jgi:hypothetical protein
MPVTDEICGFASLPVAINGERLMVFGGRRPALARLGRILIAGRSLERLEKMLAGDTSDSRGSHIGVPDRKSEKKIYKNQKSLCD